MSESLIGGLNRLRLSAPHALGVGVRDPFRDESGMTSAGMAVALLVCLSLIFSSAQVYRSTSAAAEAQEVADVAVLAAENEVAEFTVAVNVCDAVVLSMTLLSATVLGVGVVAACVPPLASVSAELISLGEKVASARDAFSERACAGLNSLQRALPFLAAASASSLAAANNSGAMEGDYIGTGVLVPAQGEDIAFSGDSLSDVGAVVSNSEEGIREKAAKAEELAGKAASSKEAAFLADCGNSPGRCQYERAVKLSDIDDADNPLYESMDAWSFSVALERARAYFASRLELEESSSGDGDLSGHSFRLRFYQYVVEQLDGAYAHETSDCVRLYFPKIFHNLEEFRQTSLYAETVYPLTQSADDGGGQVIHSCGDCPAASGIIGYGSMSQLESGAYVACSACGMSVEGLGNVAAASTNVSTGFEHFYEAIRVASEEYQVAMDELVPAREAVQDDVQPVLELIGELLSEVGSKRISANPPGRNGCIAIVVNKASQRADLGFESLFVEGGMTLGSTAAVSGATLVEDSSHDSSSLITSLLDGFGQDGGAAVGAARVVLDMWSGLLKAYEDGQSALASAVENVLGSLSLGTASGLGKWASESLSGVVDAAGLQPAHLKARKAVLLNTGYVASSDTGSFAVSFIKAKSTALAASSSSSDVLTGAISSLSDDAISAVSDATITIAEIEFPVGGSVIPIRISLPEGVKSAATGIIANIRDSLVGLASGLEGVRVWQ